MFSIRNPDFKPSTSNPEAMQSNGQPTIQPLLLPAREAARMLSISERTLWSITAPRGPIPSIRVRRSVRYSVAALEQWIASQQADSDAASSTEVSASSAADGQIRDEPAG